LDDKWKVGNEINRLQIPKLWVHFRALAVPKRRRKTTQEAVEAALQKVTPHYMVPQGSACEISSQDIAIDPNAKAADYTTAWKVKVTLL